MLYTILFLLISSLNSSTSLLPEVEPFTHINPINEKQMDQNAYVYLMALDAVDDSYFEIGKKILLHNNKVTQEAVKEHDETIIENASDNMVYDYDKLDISWAVSNKKYNYACNDFNNKHCVDDILKDSKVINVLLNENKKLLTRYEHILELPGYDSYPPITLSSPIPRFHISMRLSELRQAQAILLIEQGNISQGLMILQQEINFSKRILRGNAGLIDEMIGIRLLLTQYHTVEILLDHNLIKKNLINTQLVALLAPFTIEEQLAMESALENEFYFMVTYWQTFSFKYIGSLFFNRNQTINDAFLMMQPVIKQTKITLPEAKNTYQALLNDKVSPPLCESGQIFCIVKLYEKYGFNLLGGGLLEIAKPDYKTFIFRFYGLQSYLALVDVKLLIKQQKISKEQLPSFLESLGDKAKNPYTGQPFKWDKTTSTLSTESISPDIVYTLSNMDKDRLSISITFN